MIRFESYLETDSSQQPQAAAASINFLDFLGTNPKPVEEQQPPVVQQEESGIEFLNQYLSQEQEPA